MKKISFNDLYGLTQAVIEGRKTMIRKPIPYIYLDLADGMEDTCIFESQGDKRCYNYGEIVAIAQRYSDIEEYNPADYEDAMLSHGVICEGSHPYSNLKNSAGWNSKRSVRSNLMPHQIRITGIKVERLQDISEEDIMKEGIIYIAGGGYGVRFGENYNVFALNPIVAFATLIDKVSGKGTWERNPWVFVYTFELIR